MSKPERGIPPIPSLLMKPTPHETPVADQAEAAEQGGEPSAQASRPRPRRRRVPAGGETRGHKLALPDALFDRLQFTAIQRKSNISAVAVEILDRNLPRWRLERDG